MGLRTYYYLNMLRVVLTALIMTTQGSAAEKLEKGKDRIDTLAIGSGLCVHNLFQSNMVLQRDKPIRLWGWAKPGENVSVSFGGNTQSSTAAADRLWKVELPALPASSDPQTMLVKGEDDKIELENMLVGDVWLLGGQSNMEFEIHKTEGGPLEIVSANFKNIRLFSVPQQNGPDVKNSFPRQYQWSDFFGQHFRQGYWDVCTPETVSEMSGIGYVFARRIHMATQIPIGIVDVSRGGSSLVSWMPTDVLKSIDTPEVKATLDEWNTKVSEFNAQKDLDNRIKQYNDWAARMKADGKPIPADRKVPSELQPGPALDMNRPGNLYASMLAPITGISVKGVIWHQGYNESAQPNGHKLYAGVFPEMIKTWRAAFNEPTMPFGIITQETQGQPQTLENFLPDMVDEGNYVREVHYQTFLNLRKAGDKTIGYASSFDQHRAWYHPQLKIQVGERIAGWALATQYGKSIRWLPPQLKEVKATDGKLFLQLDTWAGPYHDGPIQGFAIAGKDGRFQPAKAEWLDKNAGKGGEPNWERTMIVLTSPLVPEPLYFRYAWARNPLENLKSTDKTNLPFDTQRNDTWTLADMYEIYTGMKTKTLNVLDRLEQRDLTNALKSEDLKRRIGEAKALLKANNIKVEER
ncbi:MAG: sialate O-acetylesterase [Pirellula sp.]